MNLLIALVVLRVFAPVVNPYLQKHLEKIGLKIGRAYVLDTQAKRKRKIYQGQFLAAQAFLGQPRSHRSLMLYFFPRLNCNPTHGLG